MKLPSENTQPLHQEGSLLPIRSKKNLWNKKWFQKKTILTQNTPLIHTSFTQNGICIKNYSFCSKNNGEKWSRKNSFEITQRAKPFGWNQIQLIERRIFEQNYKFSDKNYNLCERRDFQKILFDTCSYYKWNFKPYKPSIFYFGYVKEVWTSAVAY